MNEPDPTESQVAYRLAYEEVIRWRAELDAQLDRIRNRAMGFLAVAALAAGTGLSSFPVKSTSPRPSILWVVLIGIGVLANLLAVIGTLRALHQGPFGDSPRALLARGDDKETYPTSDSVYRNLADWGDSNTWHLYLKIDARQRWLYVSMAGITIELAGLAALHWSRLFP